MKIVLKRHRLLTYFLFLLLYFGIIIDNIVGFQMRTTQNESLVSKLYRLFIFMFVLVIIFLCKQSGRFFFLFGFSLPVFQMIASGNIDGFLVNELYIAKLLYPIALIMAGMALIKSQRINLKDVDQYLLNISWIYPLTIIIPYIFGLGFKAYKATGFSGFYSAGNEISVILGVCFIIHINSMFERITIKSVFGVLLATISTILTGTKAGIVIICLATIYYFVRLVWGNKNKIIKMCYFIVIIAILLVFANFVFKMLQHEISASIEMFQYKFRQLNYNVVDFIFSKRNTKIAPNFERLREEPWSLFIGNGYYGQVVLNDTRKGIASAGLIEMDFFDILFQYGVIMAVSIWTSYLKGIIKYRNSFRNQYTFAGGMMLLYSFMAGHTLYSAHTGTVLAILIIGGVLAHNNVEANKG